MSINEDKEKKPTLQGIFNLMSRMQARMDELEKHNEELREKVVTLTAENKELNTWVDSFTLEVTAKINTFENDHKETNKKITQCVNKIDAFTMRDNEEFCVKDQLSILDEKIDNTEADVINKLKDYNAGAFDDFTCKVFNDIELKISQEVYRLDEIIKDYVSQDILENKLKSLMSNVNEDLQSLSNSFQDQINNLSEVDNEITQNMTAYVKSKCDDILTAANENTKRELEFISAEISELPKNIIVTNNNDIMLIKNNGDLSEPVNILTNPLNELVKSQNIMIEILSNLQKPKVKPDEERLNKAKYFKKLKNSGKTYKEIGEKHGLTAQTVSKMVRRLKNETTG